MALTQVRAKLEEEWVTLTYNTSTGRYEGTLYPQGTSIHQTGGYYNVEVEATNETGETATIISGIQLPALRLVVRETTAPVLTLVSPQPGYLMTGGPTFVFQAVDEEGGSEVNPNSWTINGQSPAAAGMEVIPGGYRLVWIPPEPWPDGPRTITASVRDYDGNESTVSGSYVVDTVPPELLLRKPDQRHVVDDETVLVAGEAWDVTAPDVTVLVGGQAVPVSAGRFEREVPLAIGENHIEIKVTDGAGNVTTADVYMIRLVTDRTANDVEFLANLYNKPWEEWPEATQAWFLQAACLRGAYDPTDWNRVGIAAAWLAGELKRRGYMANVTAKTNWTPEDAPTLSQMKTYIQNVESIRTAQPIYVTEIPGTLQFATYDGWNRIEKALVEVDEVFPRYTAWTSGEITAGGF